MREKEILQPTKVEQDRFWSKIQEMDTGCYYFTGYKGPDGYGRVRLRGIYYQAHILAYLLSKGSIAAEQVIMHTCDNRYCCNPEHLIAGTQQDNMTDAHNKDRVGRPKAIIDKKQVLEIYNRIDAGDSLQAITKDYPIDYGGVYSISRGKTWKLLFKQWKGGDIIE